MSYAGLGAFTQGLTQGYVVGDKLKTADEEREASKQIRELRGLQIGEEQRKIKLRDELEAFRPQVSQAIAQMLANPDDESVAKNYNDTMVQYYTKFAKPEEAATFAKTVKDDRLKDGARKAANIFGRLQMQDPTAIAEFANTYKAKPDGLDIDPARTGYTKDGGIRLGLFKTDTGEALPEKVIGRDQLIQSFAQFLSNPKDVVDFYQSSRRLDLTERGQDMDYRSTAARTGVMAEGNRINAGIRADAQADRNLQTDLSEIRNVFAPRIKAIQDNIDSKYDSKKQAELLGAEETRMGFVDSVVRANAQNGIRVPVRQVAAQADALMRGEGIVGVPKGMENSGYGITRQGFLVPLPPNARVTPRQ